MDTRLTEYHTDALASELASREDYRDDAGFLIDPLYKIRVNSGPIPCVDVIALRKSGEQYEALAIRRKTGFYAGRLCTIGGSILLGESFEDAIRRHVQTDIGVEIELLASTHEPTLVLQYYSPKKDGVAKEGFMPEPSKHSIGIFFPVRLKSDSFQYGKTRHGGQEASSVEWISLENLPQEDDFGYGQRFAYIKMLREASRYLP